MSPFNSYVCIFNRVQMVVSGHSNIPFICRKAIIDGILLHTLLLSDYQANANSVQNTMRPGWQSSSTISPWLLTIASTVYAVDYYTLYSFALNASSTVMENMTFITVKNHRILFFIHNLQSSQWSDTTTITTVTTTWVLILDKPCMLFIYVSHFHIWCDMSTSPSVSSVVST